MAATSCKRRDDKRRALHRVVRCAMQPQLELLIEADLMASQIMERLRKELLGLSEAERAELARDLVKSLDGPADISAATDWDVEIVRRIEQIDAGTAKTVDRDEFRRRLRERTGRA